MPSSVTARLTLGFLVTLISLLIIAVLAVQSFSRLFSGVSLIQSHHVRETAIFEDIRVLLTDAVHQDRGYIQTGVDSYDEAFEADVDEINRLFEEHAAMHKIVPITPPEVTSITRLKAAVNRLSGAHDQVEELVVEGQLSAARRLSAQSGQAAAQAALAEVRVLVQGERREADELMAAAQANAGRTYRLILLLSVVAVVVSGGAALSLIRSVTVPVHRLLDVTRRVDRGNLAIRSGLRGRDEVGEMAQSFDRMVGRLEAAFAQQEKFLADVSHELRTPITVVRGHLEVLRRGAPTPDRVERAIAIGLDELERMGRLVDELLLLVRATRVDFLKVEMLPLPDFLAEILGKAEAVAPRAWRLGAVADVTVPADRDRLTQALLNLLRNAAEHTPSGGAVVLSATAADGVVRIAVRDEGAGIAPALLPHIFERFQRGEDSPGSGWGLGLSIVQAIAHAHHGEVGVESRPGGGSTFTITLPLPPMMPT